MQGNDRCRREIFRRIPLVFGVIYHFLSASSAGMMPFWMFTLGQELTQGESEVHVPYGNLVVSLISLTVPVGIGVAIRMWRPAWAERGGKIIKPFTLLIIVFFLSVSVNDCGGGDEISGRGEKGGGIMLQKRSHKVK